MKKLIAIAAFLLLGACGDGGAPDDYGDVKSALESALETNETWPYEAVGILEIVEAGFDDNSEYAAWAVGSLLTDDDDEWGIMIEIGEGVAQKARIDIDSGQKVRVWLGRPENKYGDTSYPVVRMQRL